jgi:photosystem II stability/assembly factor-like uncharacterized protein
VIIGALVSLLRMRLGATFVALWVVGIAALNALAEQPADSTWTGLKPLPHQGKTAIFGLAVDPANNQVVVAANSEGTLLRTPNAGVSWTAVHSGKPALVTVAFDPYVSGLVLAGTRGAGALVSRDGGATWSAATGLEGRTVKVFTFALSLLAAGTDRGVYLSADGSSWAPSGLTAHSINALATLAIHSPVRLLAAGDAQASSGVMPLYQSVDAGVTWTQLSPPISGTITVKLAAGPLPPTGNVRPLVVGTNTGLFASSDNGATFDALSGGALLPATDYTQVDFVADHFDRFYAASDGGASKSGGLWRTDDAGQSFRSLQPPEPSVTALAVSSDDQPVLYVATFNPATHVASLWTYHDTGGQPQGPAGAPSPAASGTRGAGPSADSPLGALLASPQLPYVTLGLGALAVLFTAILAHLRGRVR